MAAYTPRLRSISLLAAFSAPPHAPPQILPGFHRGTGLGFIVAPGGTGKSFLLLELAVELALGETQRAALSTHHLGPLLGGLSTDPVRVAAVMAEDPEWAVAGRLASIGGLYRPAARALVDARAQVFVRASGSLALAEQSRSGGVEFTPFFEREILPLMDTADVLLLDPWAHFHRLETENAAMPFAVLFDRLADEAQARRCDIIIAAHTTKAAERDGDDSAAAMRGSGAQAYGARWLLALRRPTDAEREAWLTAGMVGATDRLVVAHQAKPNYGSPPADVVLRRDPATGVLLPVPAAFTGAGSQPAGHTQPRGRVTPMRRGKVAP